MARKKIILIAKNPSEARGIRKALKAAGVKVDKFTPTRGGKKKRRNPKKARRRKAKKNSSRRRRR